ncbi:concanavalin A-like lectin/glucanase domain-containing protein [Kickxella alabastrina]|uniref:concanavalin A-like lectin/glucanase domain-containing protein n=1 Tax=Kickxella alabastrina TaxID=61397 RepID=UPI00221E83E7|nr:concanavalin A-like lectin/glucanase domain-containing protein [Kickxella alabastrina]KAI7835208.1 concanavalin A-like lectin/glucanase domain-containing protein [Kickxella alabastrina]
MMKFSSAFAAAVGILFASSTAVSAQSTCNEWSPCFREGYCDADAMFCLWGLCDETKSFNSTSCWKPEGCSSQTVVFDNSADVVPIRSYGGNPNTSPFLSIFEPSHASVANGALELQMTYDAAQKKGFGATVDAAHTIQYGKVTARVKTASVAPGVVSSFIIRNDVTGDEIDFEWVGKAPREVQTNFYFNDILDYTQMVPYVLQSDTSADYHDYTIDWTAEAITWLVDGVVIRTVKKADTFDAASNSYKFPTSEARVAFSIWDAGNSGAQGTQEWAGYPTPWNNGAASYKMFVDSVSVQCDGSAMPSESSATVAEPSATDAVTPPVVTDQASYTQSPMTDSTGKKCRPHY